MLQPIALVGLPGVGKSTIGRRLARVMGRTLLDTDAMVEAAAGLSIAEIFEREGEPVFRELEAAALARCMTHGSESVISTGGGIVLAPRNRTCLATETFAIYLRVPAERLISRLARGQRPAFRSGDVAGKLSILEEQRDPLYRAVASLTLDVERMPLTSIVEQLTIHLDANLPHKSASTVR